MDSNTEFKKIDIRIRTCYCFDDIIKIERLCNILIDEKSYENISVYNIHTKLWLILNLCVLGSMKQMDLLEFMMELDI